MMPGSHAHRLSLGAPRRLSLTSRSLHHRAATHTALSGSRARRDSRKQPIDRLPVHEGHKNRLGTVTRPASRVAASKAAAASSADSTQRRGEQGHGAKQAPEFAWMLTGHLVMLHVADRQPSQDSQAQTNVLGL